MIDRTQLTEALNKTGIAEFVVNEDTEPHHVRLVRDAAKWARDFPTDAQVEAAHIAYEDQYDDMEENGFNARAVLEAITMIGDNDDLS